METALSKLRVELRPLFALTIVIAIITTGIYPLVMTGIGQALFHRQVNGSIISVDGQDVGSSLLGQSFAGDQYFQGRPSAAGAGYDAASSSGSNLAPTSDKFINGIADDPETADVDESFAGIVQRVQAFRDSNGLDPNTKVPADAVTASGSGLDPHVSPATARLQVARVAKARGAGDADVLNLVNQYTEDAFLGFIGEPRVNVLKLNIALDKAFPMKKG